MMLSSLFFPFVGAFDKFCNLPRRFLLSRRIGGLLLGGARRFLVGILTKIGVAKGTVDQSEASVIDLVNVNLFSLG